MSIIRRETWQAFIAGAISAAAVTVATMALQASAAPGDAAATFVPIAPCRLIDTRPAPDRVGSHGSLVWNNTEVLTGRGARGNCNIPTDATALGMNVTAVSASEATFVTIWPSGPRPTVSSLNPAPGLPPTPNAVTAPLASNGTFRVFNLAGTVDLIMDVNGYYTKSPLDQIEARLTVLEGGGIAPGASGFSAMITGYGPGFSITDVSGVVTSGLSDEADVRVDVRCPNGNVETDHVFNVPAGATRGFSVLCDGVFTGGATVVTVRV